MSEDTGGIELLDSDLEPVGGTPTDDLERSHARLNGAPSRSCVVAASGAPGSSTPGDGGDAEYEDFEPDGAMESPPTGRDTAVELDVGDIEVL